MTRHHPGLLPKFSAAPCGREQNPHSWARHQLGDKPPLTRISAGVCAFSLTLRITQRDGTTRARHTEQPHPPVPPATRDRTGRLHRDIHGRPPPGPGSPGVRRHRPAARPSRSPVLVADGIQTSLPGSRSHLRRDPRSTPPPGDGPRAAGTTTGTPAHRGNPGRPCRRQMRAFAPGAPLHKYTAEPLVCPPRPRLPTARGTLDNRAQSRRSVRLGGCRLFSLIGYRTGRSGALQALASRGPEKLRS